MKAIALIGEGNSGKTNTLRLVHAKMIARGYQSPYGTYEDFGNRDFLDVLIEKEHKLRIALISQGDYANSHANGAISVPKLLQKAEEVYNADILLCTGNTGASKGAIKKALDEYQAQFIAKNKNSYDDENVSEKILTALADTIQELTK